MLAFYWLQLAMAMVGIVGGAGALAVNPAMGRGQGSFWVAAFAGGSVIWLVTQLVSFRLPAGLRISLQGITGVRGVGRRVFSWEELVAAAPETEGREVALGFTDTNGLVTNIGASYYLGSDPALVAIIVNHFIDHPEHRHLLNDPHRAIRRVEQTVNGGRPDER